MILSPLALVKAGLGAASTSTQAEVQFCNLENLLVVYTR